MTLDLIICAVISMFIIFTICWRLSKDDEEFDTDFRDEEEG